MFVFMNLFKITDVNFSAGIKQSLEYTNMESLKSSINTYLDLLSSVFTFTNYYLL